MSPTYDVAFSYNPAGEYTSLHQMSVNGKRDNFIKADEIIEEVFSSVLQWDKVASEYGVLKAIASVHRLK